MVQQLLMAHAPLRSDVAALRKALEVLDGGPTTRAEDIEELLGGLTVADLTGSSRWAASISAPTWTPTTRSRTLGCCRSCSTGSPSSPIRSGGSGASMRRSNR